MRKVLLLLCVLPFLIGFTPQGDELVASGTVTRADMRLSIVDGTAFVDFSAANVLTDYIGCRLEIADSANRKVIGCIKAAGTGETLSGELLTDPGFDNSGAWDRIDANWTIATSNAVSDGTAAGRFGMNTTYTTGALYKIGLEVSALSADSIRMWSHDATIRAMAVLGSNTAYYTPEGTSAQTYTSNTQICTLSEGTIKQVLTPATTGVTITSTKGGTSYGWSHKNASFVTWDTANYTYQIYRTAPVMVASGSITPADCCLSLYNGQAFAWLNGVDLTAYQDGRHLLVVQTYTPNYAASGWISATPPGGETIGANLQAGWTFLSGWTAANSTINDADTFTANANSGMVYGGASLTKGKLAKFVIDGAVSTGIVSLHRTGGNAVLCVMPGTGYGTRLLYNTATLLRASTSGAVVDITPLEMYEVTDCPSTGVLIVSTQGGAVRNWTYAHATFEPQYSSQNLTYKIYFVGN